MRRCSRQLVTVRYAALPNKKPELSMREDARLFTCLPTKTDGRAPSFEVLAADRCATGMLTDVGATQLLAGAEKNGRVIFEQKLLADAEPVERLPLSV